MVALRSIPGFDLGTCSGHILLLLLGGPRSAPLRTANRRRDDALLAQVLMVSGDPDGVARLKRNLAQIILASACKDEREVEQLKAIALKALG